MRKFWLAAMALLLLPLAACDDSEKICDDNGLCVTITFICNQQTDKRTSVEIQANSSASPSIPVRIVVEDEDGVFIKDQEGAVGAGSAMSNMLLRAHDKVDLTVRVLRDGGTEVVDDIDLRTKEACRDGDKPL